MHYGYRTELTSCFVGCSVAELHKWFFFAFCLVGCDAEIANFRVPESEIGASPEFRELINRVWGARRGGEMPEDRLEELMRVWGMLYGTLFDDDGHIVLENLVDMFSGIFQLAFLDDMGEEGRLLLMRTVRLGIGLSYLASAGTAPDESASWEEVLEFVDEFDQETVLTTFNSPEFTRAFEERRRVISMERGSGSGLLMFNRATKPWAVFQMRHEWIRALWCHDFRDVLFYGQSNSERMAIQNNNRFLNNVIIQASDLPVGYPAYVSGVVTSFATW
jgi:hypothetical protein